MSIVPIVVRWTDAREAFKIDLDRIKNGEMLLETTETEIVKGVLRFWRYNTTSEFAPDGAGGRLTIHYRKAKNRHLPAYGRRWGKTLLDFYPGHAKGRAEWIDNNEEYDAKRRKIHGGETTWKLVSPATFHLTQRERKTIERTARQQAQFRLQLLMIDPKCAITGEEEKALLEAAHVVPVAKKGPDVAANGVLLRADLHRLYDAGLFRIARDGSVIPSKALKSTTYRDLLERARVDRDTLDRIAGAWRASRRKR